MNLKRILVLSPHGFYLVRKSVYVRQFASFQRILCLMAVTSYKISQGLFYWTSVRFKQMEIHSLLSYSQPKLQNSGKSAPKKDKLKSMALGSRLNEVIKEAIVHIHTCRP